MENVLLAELVYCIDQKTVGRNLILKLDMVKLFDGSLGISSIKC